MRWAAESQEWWREKGFPPATLRRYIVKPPFVRKCRHVDDKVTTLIRVGTPGPETDRDRTNELARLWRKKMKRALTEHQLKCLYGLVKQWPEGKAAELLALVIDNWPQFMVGAHFEIEKLGDQGHKWFLEFPSPSVILRFHAVAVHMLHMKLQEAGKPGLAECMDAA